MKPIITIGLPFYNNEETLLWAIKSVLMQTFQEWELILINDGSNDHSIELAQMLADTDKRIYLINDGENKGLVFRLNQIIDMARGDYIARMDADDIMMPDKIERQIEFFKENPEVDVLGTSIFTIDKKNIPIGIRHTQEFGKSGKSILLNSSFNHPTIVSKTNWSKMNKYDDRYYRAEDRELWCRTYSFSIFAVIPEPLFIYREGHVNIKNYLATMKTLRKILKEYGPNTLRQKEQWIAIVKTYLKAAIYVFAGLLHCQHYLSQKRNIPLNKEQIKMVNNIIFEINSL